MGYLDKEDQLDGDEWKQIFDGEHTAVQTEQKFNVLHIKLKKKRSDVNLG